jgi:hypothetical protein
MTMTRRHIARRGMGALILAVLLAGLALPAPAGGVAAAPPLPAPAVPSSTREGGSSTPRTHHVIAILKEYQTGGAGRPVCAARNDARGRGAGCSPIARGCCRR